ncbi:MAG: cation transporter [Planctomycetes bacterium]|nr:cation transporter [Planctomycetota bacterium]
MTFCRLSVFPLVLLAIVAGSGCTLLRKKSAEPATGGGGRPAVAPAPAAADAPTVPTAAAQAAAAPSTPLMNDEPRVVRLLVPDMEDLCCAERVEEILAGVPGVRSARVDFPSRVAVVIYAPDRTPPERLLEALRKEKWDASAIGGTGGKK